MGETKKSLDVRWGRFLMDQSEESQEAFEILDKSNIPFTTFRVNGDMGPELKIKRRVYEGLEEIKALVESDKVIK